ncbi:MAG: M56 family metallopeptidase [Oscillospiraceae bacterium]|nr:M56 family metallopeptidase [Oscillospiraceae bacterium]
MSHDLVIKSFCVGLMCLILSWAVFSRYDTEMGEESLPQNGQRYLPLISGYLLPTYLFIMLVMGLKFLGTDTTLKMMLTLCFDIFLSISLYYVVLLPLLPFLRRHISARTCAMLWLLPNYMYMLDHDFMKIAEPLFIVHASSKTVKILSVVWAVGFSIVFLWNIIQHLLFRRKLLKNAVPVTDGEVFDLFWKEVNELSIHKPKFKLVISDEVATPLTIGLFRRSTRVILPPKHYTADELRLIFRHELIHICREDSRSKFFMMFCSAMCWFNPLMWYAMKKSAEDTELSCDETVLLGEDDATRRQYASLILDTAGDDRGFSTCLASSLSSMRYRLKSIVKPQKRSTGALVVTAVFFVLLMSSGYVALAYGERSGADTVYRGHNPEDFVARSITVEGGDYELKTDNVDAFALTQYISSLPTQEITGNYSYSGDEKVVELRYGGPYGSVFVELHTDYIRVLYTADERDGWYTYHLPQPVDWEYVYSIVPPLPVASVSLQDSSGYFDHTLTAKVTKYVRHNNGETDVLRDIQLDLYDGPGIYGGTVDYLGGKLKFSTQPVSNVEIFIENWDYTSAYSLTFDPQAEEFEFEIPHWPAHYTITASFCESDTVYDTTFQFHIGNADSI